MTSTPPVARTTDAIATLVARLKTDDPIEIRLDRSGQTADGPRRPFVLLATVRNGVIAYELTVGGDGAPQALANLQARRTWPRKAIFGWQAEVLDVALTSPVCSLGEVR